MPINPYIQTHDEETETVRSSVKMQIKTVGIVMLGIIAGLLVASRFINISLTPKTRLKENAAAVAAPISSTVDTAALQQQVLPSTGVMLPINWGTLGKRMIADGVIDETKFRAIFSATLSADEETMLTGDATQPTVLNAGNSRFLLDILWAFGLANKNEILEKGEMVDKQYDGAGNFASTGGWTLSKGKPMDHYSKHAYVALNPEQQTLVDRVSRTIYRPCCNNSTHFPDCNHGMAMLGLLELMAAQNTSEADMYAVALAVNSYWFPQTYLDLAAYFKEQGKDWNTVDPKTVLGFEYSSAQGYQQTRTKILSLPQPAKSGGGCGA